MYEWFPIFELQSFRDTGLWSRELTVVLGSFGEKKILISVGCTISVTVDDAFLPIGFLGRAVYESDGYAVAMDTNGYVQLGVAVPA